jgi:hypothetical protein
MKALLTLAACGLFIALAHAQPVLTHAGNAPQPGTTYTMRYGPYVQPGSAGVNQTWDLSGLVTDSTRMIMLVQPAATQHGTSFSSSTVAETGADAVMYFRSATDGVYFVGSEADGLLIVHSDQGSYLPFPCTYQTEWTDAVAAQFTVDGIDVDRTGTITGVADGHGTLILPTGEVNDVLRIHWHQEIQDVSPFFAFGTITDSHLFYVSGQSYPLVQLVTTTSTFFGQTTTMQHAQWVGDLSTGISATQGASQGMNVYPVPARDRLMFNLPVHFSGSPLITITDGNGRRVQGLRAVKVTGTQGHADVSGLPAGVYHFLAIDELGQRATARFIVQ